MPGSGRARAPRTTASQGGSNSSNAPATQSTPPIAESNEASGAIGSATNTSRVINSEGSSSKKQGRGPTRGLGLAKKKQRGEDLQVLVSENRLVGRNKSNYVNELGIIIRDYAPFNVRYWKEIPEEDITKMWEMLRDKFNLPNDEELRERTVKQMNKQWVNFRSAMHCREFKKYESMEIALQHCPKALTQDKWQDLCQTFVDSKFQERSKINQQNRGQQTIVHTTGSKGFHCLEYEMTQEVGEKPTMKQFWMKSHTTKKKDGDNGDDGLDVDGDNGLRWVNKEAKKVYDDVEALQLQSLVESGVTLEYNEAYQQVLGPRSGHIRGRGAGPKPISSSTRAIEKEKEVARDKQLADARREADEARREADEANKKVEILQGQFDQFKKDVENMMNLMMRNREVSLLPSAAVHGPAWLPFLITVAVF